MAGPEHVVKLEGPETRETPDLLDLQEVPDLLDPPDPPESEAVTEHKDQADFLV